MDLTDAREKAKERMKGVCAVYKVCDGHPDRLCQGIKYGKPLGMGGIGKGTTFTANIEALDRLHLKTRLISSHSEPEMKASFLGHEVAFPIFCTSMSGVKISMGGAISELEFAQAVIRGARQQGPSVLSVMAPKPSRIGPECRQSGKPAAGACRSSNRASKRSCCA